MGDGEEIVYAHVEEEAEEAVETMAAPATPTPTPTRTRNQRTPNVKGIRVTAQLPDSAPPALYPPKAVHQCTICNKIFVSFKGLQQHAVIHTDQKPFACDICGKAFRFKSNLFEHRSVHSGFTPHSCPYCGKTCRLKGNLKKHLKTHVNSKEELEEAWKPFASNRRPPAEVPEDAIIVRSTGEPYFTPVSRPRKKKLGLGQDSKPWVEKVRKGDLLPTSSIQEKLHRLSDLLRSAEENYFSAEECLEQARAIPLERFDCPLCKHVFMSRLEAAEHLELEHPTSRSSRPMFCDICLRSFGDRKAFDQHVGYHNRIHLLVKEGHLRLEDPPLQDVVEDYQAEGEVHPGQSPTYHDQAYHHHHDDDDPDSANLIAAVNKGQAQDSYVITHVNSEEF